MAKYVGLQSARAQLQSATGRRLIICNVSRKPSTLSSQQVLEDARESRSDVEEIADTLPDHAVSRLNPSGNAAAERKASHGMASTSEPAAEPNSRGTRASKKTSRGRPTKKGSEEDPHPTETVFIGEVPGFGWSEGFLPQFRTEQRPIEPLKKRRGRKKKCEVEALTSMEDLEQPPEELEIYLVELGVPKSEVQELMDTAVAWRVTPGGRPLIDRRRQSRLARNVRIVAEYLQKDCGVPFGPQGIAAVFLQVPELMLCKPTSNDRWDRRAVELAAYRLKNGHCNVPENWEPNVELGTWVKRQRVARAAGQLSEERLQILERMGFEFGDLAQITEEWEMRFDQLIDWMLWHGENGQTFSWVGVDWGARGGVTARELALWMALQREFRRRQLLPAEAEQRFDALQVDWGTGEDQSPAVEWMQWLGRLLYVVERRCLDTMRPIPKLFGKRVGSTDDSESSEEEESSGTVTTSSTGTGTGTSSGITSLGPAGQRKRGPPSAARAMKAQLAATMVARRESLMKANPVEEPGLGFWVARQQWRWRRGDLPAEQARMLHLAGVDMDTYSHTEWQSNAHIAAETLQGSLIALGVTEGAVMPPPPIPATAAAAAAGSTSSTTVPAGNVAQGRTSPRPNPVVGSSSATATPTTSTSGSRLQDDDDGLEEQVPPPIAGSRRLQVRRWVQTQRALFRDGRISPGQLRYLQFLGITWILSDEVMCMEDDAWEERYAQLERKKKSSRLAEWLEHQRGLYALGLIDPARRAALEKLGISWRFDRPVDADIWDLRLSQLLVQSVAVGNVEVLPENERFVGLREWLREQKELAGAGRLPNGRVAQLKALGVSVPIA